MTRMRVNREEGPELRYPAPLSLSLSLFLSENSRAKNVSAKNLRSGRAVTENETRTRAG